MYARNSKAAITPVNQIDTNIKSNDLDRTKPKSLRKGILSSISNTADRSSIHGFPSFAAPTVHWFAKIVWFVCCGCSWGYLIFQINNSIILYSSYSVVSSTSIAYEAPTDFFAVDVCNLNPISPSFSLTQFELFLSNQTSLYMNNSRNILSFTDNYASYLQIGLQFAQLQNFNVYYAGMSISDMLVSCEYNGVKCTANDFYWYYSFYYGNCYRFNGGPQAKSQLNGPGLRYESRSTLRSYQSGWRYGLRLELYSPTAMLETPYTYKTGFRIAVHNQSSEINPDEEGLDVPLGFETNIAVSRTFVNRLSKPYSNCIEQLTAERASENQVLTAIYGKIASGELQAYQMSFCLKACYQYYLLGKCNCGAPALIYLNVSSIFLTCNGVAQLACLRNASNFFYESTQVDNCYNICPLECKSSIYETKTSSANYPTQWLAKRMNQYQSLFNLTSVYNQSNITYDLVKSSTAFVNVFYDRMEYILVDESPSFTFDFLIANIGGNLGLFTGMSVLSVVELFEVMISITVLVLCTRKGK